MNYDTLKEKGFRSGEIGTTKSIDPKNICLSNKPCDCGKIHTFVPNIDRECKNNNPDIGHCGSTNCWYAHTGKLNEVHSSLLKNMTLEPCRNPIPCPYRDCRRVHNRPPEPASFVSNWGVCPYGDKCLFKDHVDSTKRCQLVHTKILKTCRYGGCCNQQHCPFTHTKNIPCKFKTTCIKRGCLYTCERTYLYNEPCQGHCVYNH